MNESQTVELHIEENPQIQWIHITVAEEGTLNQKEEERAEDNDNEQGIGWMAILVKLRQLFEAPESQKPPKPSIRSLP